MIHSIKCISSWRLVLSANKAQDMKISKHTVTKYYGSNNSRLKDFRFWFWRANLAMSMCLLLLTESCGSKQWEWQLIHIPSVLRSEMIVAFAALVNAVVSIVALIPALFILHTDQPVNWS